MATALEILRGDDEVLDLAFKQADGTTPLNITGALGIWFTAKRSSLDDDVDALIAKILTAGQIVITNAAGGLATVTINAADTAAIEPTTLVWDAQIKDAGSNIRTAASGTLKVVGDVTRATA